MPTSDFRLSAEVLSGTTMAGSGIEGVNRPEIAGFLVETMDRGLSDEFAKAKSFVEIFEILK
jgi:hypothetical protein